MAEGQIACEKGVKMGKSHFLHALLHAAIRGLMNDRFSNKALTSKGRAALQSLPRTDKGFAKQRITPTRKSVRANYAPEQIEEIAEAMAASLVFTFSWLAESPKMPGHPKSELTEGMMTKHLGRCFWSWDDIPMTEEKGTAQFVAPLAPIALRNTEAFPTDMKALSPRMAVDLLMAPIASVEQMVERFLASAGLGEPKRYGLALALVLTGYGIEQDQRLPRFQRTALRPKRAGYNARQSLILDLAAGTDPFSQAILTHTLFEDDLVPRLHTSQATVEERMQQMAKVLEEKHPNLCPDVVSLLKEEPIPYAKAADKVLREPWDFPIGTVFEGQVDGDPDEIVFNLTCRMIVNVMTSDGQRRELPEEVLFALALLTGISPAAFVRYAIVDLERRGTTYLRSPTIRELAQMVKQYTQDWTGRQAAGAKSLIAQLGQLETEMDRTSTRMGSRVQHTDRLVKSRDWRVAPEWGLGWRARGMIDDMDD